MSDSKSTCTHTSNNIDDNMRSKFMESKTISKQSEETCVQHKYSRVKSSDEDSLISTDPTKPTIKKTVKVYQRKIIRRTGPNGEVQEDIIESGDMIPENTFETNFSNNVENSNTKLCGKSEVQSSYAIRSSGEENIEHYSTGPTEVVVVNEDKHSYPVGATVTKVFHQEKTRTVTHSATVKGESKILSSKSTYLLISGKSDLKVKSKEEDSVTDENNSNDDQIINAQNPEGQIQQMIKNIEENNNKEIIKEDNLVNEEIIKPTKREKQNAEPIKMTSVKMSDDQMKRRLQKLSKILKFNDNCPKIDVLAKEFIKDGEVQALEDTQTTPGILKNIAAGRMIKLHLIIFRDLFILALKKRSNELEVIECCERDKVEASKHSIPGGVKSNFVRHKKGSEINIFSCVSNNSPKKDISNHLFSLKFQKEISVSIKNIIILTAINIEDRDQWVWIISNNS